MTFETKIRLDSIQKVKDFVGVITGLEGEYDIKEGKYVIDAKSILGIFSLDLSKTLTLYVTTTEDIDTVKGVLKDFEV